MSTTSLAAVTTLCASALLAVACSSSDSPEDEGCASELVTNTTFALPQADGDRSFQAHATFDGEAIWLVHTSALIADESMRIRATRVQCDGTALTADANIEEQSGLQTEPRITSHDGRILLAWQRDDQVSATNLSTHYKVFDRDEDPAAATAHKLETELDGTAAGNTWTPELDASDAGFVIAGLRGVAPYLSFQAFAQRIDEDGELVGATIDAQLSDEFNQNNVGVDMDDEGGLVLGWTRESDNELLHAVHVGVEAGSDSPANEPIRICEGECSMVSLGGDEDHGQYLAIAMPDGSLGLKPSTLFNVEAPLLTVGSAGAAPIYPSIAVGNDGGAVAWLEQTSGFNAELHVQAFAGDGYDMVTVGEELVVPTDNPAIGPYRLSFIHIQDSVYMLTWTEGPTETLQVKWRYVDLAAGSAS